MLPTFQEGRRPRPNAHASLLNTGHTNPQARRPGSGAAQHAHQAGPAARPGPRPLATGQAVSTNARNAQTRRAVQQVLRQVQDLMRLPYATYRPGTAGRAPWQETHDEFGQLWYATRVKELWVYSHEINHWGDQEFMIANPQTGTRVYFTPAGYVSAKQQIQGTASATGEFGRVYGNTLGVIVTIATGGVALEAGAGTVAMEYAAPFMTKEVLTGAAVRAGTDTGVQLLSGFATGEGSFADRSIYAVRNLNGTSIIVAALINTEGMRLPANKFAKVGVKLLFAGSTAAAGNLVTVSLANKDKYGTGWHGVDLHNADERSDFFIGVGLSAELDVGKEYATEFLAPGLAKLARRSIAGASGRAMPAVLRSVTTQRISWPTAFGIGTTSEIRKKSWEKAKEAQKEADKKRR